MGELATTAPPSLRQQFDVFSVHHRDSPPAGQLPGVAGLLGDYGKTVAVSARDGTGIDRLREAVAERLPTERATFRLPNAPETESFIAWARDHGAREVSYEGEWVAVEYVSRPEVVAETRGRVSNLRD